MPRYTINVYNEYGEIEHNFATDNPYEAEDNLRRLAGFVRLADAEPPSSGTIEWAVTH